jgi:DUF4097 and DUF4098 domain-containing protein YvlB
MLRLSGPGTRIAGWMLAALLALAAAVALGALWPVVLQGVEARAATKETTEYDWTWTIPRGKTLEIRGINGEIHVQLASGNVARVHAVRKEHGSDPDEVTVEFSEHDGGVTVCAIYGRKNWGKCAEGGIHSHSNNKNDTEVEFTVELPAGVLLDGATVNGEVVAEKLKSPVKVNTVNGSVIVSSTEEVEAQTVNGSITASMSKAQTTRDLDFQTVNGSITIRMPEGFDAQLSASTVNGSIDTDFPVTVKGSFGRRSIRGTIGSGGPDLNLQTVNGSIRLRALAGKDI